ncbi:MAG TPA: hypothetical protein VHT03_14560, partial [Rhizomicrobium sp.]|nr:hypothetical protein [Rhizomicrobium sp.]
REGTFIELCKTLIDELNGFNYQHVTLFTRSTQSIHFYDSLIAFERGRRSPKRSFRRPELPELKSKSAALPK